MANHRLTLAGTGVDFVQNEGDTVLRAALRAGIGFPYECNSGGCGSCRFEVSAGTVENLWPQAPGLSDRDRRKQRLLACQCRATSELQIVVRTAPEYIAAPEPKRRRARFEAAADITHDLREFRFVAAGEAAFKPGQYASLALPGLDSPRCYSMANGPNPAGDWHFQIRRVAGGAASTILFDKLRRGDEVEIDGPYGLAWLREDAPRDIVCVAGGSGLAPMISIARAASAAGLLARRRLDFFYGGRTVRDVAGESMLAELPEFGRSLHYHPVVSMPETDTGPRWTGETGFVHERLRRALAERGADREFYFAGPPPMTQALQEMLALEFRVPVERLHFDRFF